jgi:hypothetical protein
VRCDPAHHSRSHQSTNTGAIGAAKEMVNHGRELYSHVRAERKFKRLRLNSGNTDVTNIKTVHGDVLRMKNAYVQMEKMVRELHQQMLLTKDRATLEKLDSVSAVDSASSVAHEDSTSEFQVSSALASMTRTSASRTEGGHGRVSLKGGTSRRGEGAPRVSDERCAQWPCRPYLWSCHNSHARDLLYKP